MLSDIEIAQAAELQPIQAVAETLGLGSSDIVPFGHHKAKVPMDVARSRGGDPAPLVLVTGVNPTAVAAIASAAAPSSPAITPAAARSTRKAGSVVASSSACRTGFPVSPISTAGCAEATRTRRRAPAAVCSPHER